MGPRSGTDRRTLILAEARVAAVLGQEYGDQWETVRRMRGSDLVGLRYHRPLDWVPYPATGDHEMIVGESFVTAEDGSGVVHLSPAFGADDYAAGQRYGLAFVQPVTSRGAFAKTVPVVGDMFVKEADKAILGELRKLGLLWRADRVSHSYPHCWRCRYSALTLREVVLVRPDDRLPRRDARTQRAGRMASTGDGCGAVWRMACREHRLGDLARSLLGHSAAGVGLRPGRDARAGHRQLCRAGGLYWASAAQ